MNEPMSKPKNTWYDEGLSFECTQCGNCCTGPTGYVWFCDEEAETMAGHLGMELEDFLKQYARKVDGRWSLGENWNKQIHGYDCVFLRRDETGKALCGIYPVRPAQCRTWPFWPENLRSSRSWQRTAHTCPGMNHGNFYPAEKIRIIRDQTPWAGGESKVNSQKSKVKKLKS